MLTLFSTPKAFAGHFDVIQKNAIRSWARLPGVELILFGRDAGTAEMAAESGARHVPAVPTNEFGTPLLSAMFAQAAAEAKNELVMYVNADVIMLPDAIRTIARVRAWRPDFLLVGRRTDLDVDTPIDFRNRAWMEELAARARHDGVLQAPEWIDYFAFPRHAAPVLPPFAVGRPGWDNWLMWNARTRGVPVVDATAAILAIHQNHDYSHVAGGKTGATHRVEAAQNNELIGTWARMFTIDDCNYVATATGVRRNTSLRYFARRLEILRRRTIDWTRPLRRRVGWRALNKTWKPDQS